MTLTPTQRAELTEAFEFVMRRYRLSGDVVRICRDNMRGNPHRAWEVYRAIWRSFGPAPN